MSNTVEQGVRMSIARRSGSFGAITVMLAVVLLASAAVLVGCGGTKESPGGPSGTGVSETTASLVVPDADKAPISAALSAAGIGGEAAYIYMNYESAAKDSVAVTGQMKNKDGAAVSKVVVKKSGDAWAVASAQ
jgi:hypothetical protein